jgi:hypothetical protein
MNAKQTLIACAFVLPMLTPGRALAQTARIELGSLNHLAAKASEHVDVNVDQAMLKQTAGFLSGKGADDEKLRALIDGITGIYVKGFEFSEPNVYTAADLDPIRKQLSGPRWSRVVSVKGKNDIAEIYLWRDNETNGGLVVIAGEPTELTVVNVVGRVDLAALALLGPIIPKLPAASGLLKK